MTHYADASASSGIHGPDGTRQRRIARAYAQTIERARDAAASDPDGADYLRRDAARLRRILARGV